MTHKNTKIQKHNTETQKHNTKTQKTRYVSEHMFWGLINIYEQQPF